MKCYIIKIFLYIKIFKIKLINDNYNNFLIYNKNHYIYSLFKVNKYIIW